MITLNDLKHVELEPTIQIRFLVITRTVRLGREARILCFRAIVYNVKEASKRFSNTRAHTPLPTKNSPKEWKLVHLERLGTIQQIGPIKIIDIIPRHHVRIHCAHEIRPCAKHVTFVVVGVDVAADDVTAVFEGEDVADEGFVGACGRWGKPQGCCQGK